MSVNANFNLGFNVNNIFNNYNVGGGLGFNMGGMNQMMMSMLGGGMQMGGMYGNMGMGNMYGNMGMGNMYGGMYSGMNNYLGMSGNMSLPIYGYQEGKAWDTTLASTLGRRDPVYLDTNKDGALNVESGKNIRFDINGDGLMDTVHEWNTKDAMLVIDNNKNGQIDNGREIMNETGLNGEQNKYKNGWEKARDVFGANEAGVIDGDNLEKARFWTDANGNGKVDEGEMKTAAEMGIVGIDTKNGKYITREQIGQMNVGFNSGNMWGNYGGYGNGMGMGMTNPYGNMGMGMFGGMGMNGGMFGGMQMGMGMNFGSSGMGMGMNFGNMGYMNGMMPNYGGIYTSAYGLPSSNTFNFMPSMPSFGYGNLMMGY